MKINAYLDDVFKNAFKSLHSVISWYTSMSGRPAGYLCVQAGQSWHTSFPIRHGLLSRLNIFRIPCECSFSGEIYIITLFISLTLLASRPLWLIAEYYYSPAVQNIIL